MTKAKTKTVRKLQPHMTYLSDQLLRRIRRQATRDGRMLASMTRRLIEEALDAREGRDSSTAAVA